jgi:hypothetical protein
MGVPPEVWGPNLWGTLHLVCLAETATPEFIQEFARVIPCPMCSDHFKELITTFPFEEAADKFEWSVFIHNQVNIRIGKPLFRVSDAYLKWTALPPTQGFDYSLLVILALWVLLIFMFLKYK